MKNLILGALLVLGSSSAYSVEWDGILQEEGQVVYNEATQLIGRFGIDVFGINLVILTQPKLPFAADSITTATAMDYYPDDDLLVTTWELTKGWELFSRGMIISMLTNDGMTYIEAENLLARYPQFIIRTTEIGARMVTCANPMQRALIDNGMEFRMIYMTENQQVLSVLVRQVECIIVDNMSEKDVFQFITNSSL